MGAQVNLPADPHSISQLARVQPYGTHPMSWAEDFVLTMQAEGAKVSPAIQRLVPLADVVLWAQQIHRLPEWQEVATRWGVRDGVDQWRTFLGIGFPVLPRARLEPGYLNQRVFRPGIDRTNHVLSATLFVRL